MYNSAQQAVLGHMLNCVASGSFAWKQTLARAAQEQVLQKPLRVSPQHPLLYVLQDQMAAFGGLAAELDACLVATLLQRPDLALDCLEATQTACIQPVRVLTLCGRTVHSVDAEQVILRCCSRALREASQQGPAALQAFYAGAFLQHVALLQKTSLGASCSEDQLRLCLCLAAVGGAYVLPDPVAENPQASAMAAAEATVAAAAEIATKINALFPHYASAMLEEEEEEEQEEQEQDGESICSSDGSNDSDSNTDDPMDMQEMDAFCVTPLASHPPSPAPAKRVRFAEPVQAAEAEAGPWCAACATWARYARGFYLGIEAVYRNDMPSLRALVLEARQESLAAEQDCALAADTALRGQLDYILSMRAASEEEASTMTCTCDCS